MRDVILQGGAAAASVLYRDFDKSVITNQAASVMYLSLKMRCESPRIVSQPVQSPNTLL